MGRKKLLDPALVAPIPGIPDSLRRDDISLPVPAPGTYELPPAPLKLMPPLPERPEIQAVSVTCDACSSEISFIIERDGMRWPGDAPLAGGQRSLTRDLGDTSDYEDPRFARLTGLCQEWHELLDRLSKKGIIPRNELQALVKDMHEKLESINEFREGEESGRRISVKLLDHVP